jgi:predicted dienelactone hydrolase
MIPQRIGFMGHSLPARSPRAGGTPLIELLGAPHQQMTTV